MHTLLRVIGNNAGLTLEGLRLVEFTSTAVEINNCEGARDRPVQLLNLTVTPKDLKAPKPAITFRANPKVTPKLNSYIHITNCRFEGDYKTGPLVFEKKDVGEEVLWNGKPLLK
jgi:hypothetical protein